MKCIPHFLVEVIRGPASASKTFDRQLQLTGASYWDGRICSRFSSCRSWWQTPHRVLTYPAETGHMPQARQARLIQKCGEATSRSKVDPDGKWGLFNWLKPEGALEVEALCHGKDLVLLWSSAGKSWVSAVYNKPHGFGPVSCWLD